MALFAIVETPDNAERKRRFNQFPWWAQIIIESPSLYEVWVPGILLVSGFWFTLLVKLSGNPIWLIVGIAFFGIAALYLFNAFETIEEDTEGKPQFGLLEVFGLRLPIVFDEGIAMKIPYISRIVRRSKEQFNDDLPVEATKCRLNKISDDKDMSFYEEVAHALNTPSPSNIKSGGSVKFTLGFTFERDWENGWAVLEYDNVGEQEGFLDISRDAIEEDLREIGRRLTWLQATFATDLISAHLVEKLTGSGEATRILQNPTPEKVAAFLNDVRINGRSYIQGLGIRIRRAQVKSVDPVGKLEEAAERAAIEEMKREGLIKNVDALGDAVEQLKQKLNDDSLSKRELINMIQVDEDGSRVEKKIIEFNPKDVDKISDTVARVIEGYLKRSA